MGHSCSRQIENTYRLSAMINALPGESATSMFGYIRWTDWILYAMQEAAVPEASGGNEDDRDKKMEVKRRF